MRALLASLLLALLLSGASAGPSGEGAPLRLRWELERSQFSAEHPEGRSRALFTLTNLDRRPLPAQGWSIYFSAMAGVELGPALEGQVLLERVVATLFRLRPAAGFQPLDSGQTLRIVLLHPELVLMPDKAPQAPYLVLDEAPGRGLAIRDYQLLPPSRPEQTELPPGAALPLATPQSLYQRYAQAAVPAELPPLFPTPLQYRRLAGTLHWDALPEVRAAPALAAQAEQLQAWLRPLFPGGQVGRGQPAVRLSLGPVAGQRSPEAYALSIGAREGVRLRAASPAGLARGLQSLRMLLPLPTAVLARQGVELPALHIVDAPRYAYRGLMLDVARNFQSKATLLSTLDLMARYKLNALHLHLSDDEGWRLEIPGLPELTEVGGRRGQQADPLAHLPPAYGSGPDLADPYGSGHYSRADYLEILRHAAALQIEVIPEIDMPAHARAAVKAMESRWQRRLRSGAAGADEFLLSEPGDRSVYRSAQLYTDHVMNPALPSTYAFVEQVVVALKAMHAEAGMPLRRLHVGGDELPAGAWEQSPACQALLKQLGASDTEALWDHFFDRVQALLRRHGIAAAGWEELGARKAMLAGEPGLAPNAHFLGRDIRLYVWNNTGTNADLAYRLANAGYATVLAPATRLYFDMAHQKDPAEPGHDWAAFLDLDQVFDFTPTRMPGRQGLSAEGRRHIIGLEATLFSETVRGPERLAQMLMPRLLGLAERAWAAEPGWERLPDPAAQARARAQFMQQLGSQLLPRLDAEAPALHYRIAPPGLLRQGDRVLARAQLPGMTLRYTSDGSPPRADSPLVQGPITARGRIAVAAFDRNGRAGRPSWIDNP